MGRRQGSRCPHRARGQLERLCARIAYAPLLDGARGAPGAPPSATLLPSVFALFYSPVAQLGGQVLDKGFSRVGARGAGDQSGRGFLGVGQREVGHLTAELGGGAGPRERTHCEERLGGLEEGWKSGGRGVAGGGLCVRGNGGMKNVKSGGKEQAKN